MTSMHTAIVALLLALTTGITTLDAADTPSEPNNHFHLSASASARVDNDRITATLVVQAQDKDAAMVADTINRTMRWALDILAEYPDILAETQNYRTWPRQDNSSARRVIGWSASQSLVLESSDLEAAAEVIQALQERLQVQGIAMSASPETRRVAVDNVMVDALEAFKQRAERVRENLGAIGYRFGSIHIDTSADGSGPYYGRDVMMMSRGEASDYAAPALEAGSSEIRVTVSGNIIID